MRKTTIFYLALILAVSVFASGYADELTYTNYSLDELFTIRNELSQEIFSRISALNSGEPITENEASDFLYATSNGEAHIRLYMGSSTDVVIPEIIDECKVTTIGEKSFYENININSVNIPSTIQFIGEDAFSGCENLTKVSFSNQSMEVLTIMNDAFYQCDISVPLIISAEKIIINPNAFALNYGLPEIVLLSKDIVFRDSPFSYCKAVKYIYMYPDADITFDGYFMNSTDGDVFENLVNLEAIYLPDDCPFLNGNTFKGSPRVIVYSRENSKVEQLAKEYWIPVNTENYDSMAFEVLKKVAEAGFNVRGCLNNHNYT